MQLRPLLDGDRDRDRGRPHPADRYLVRVPRARLGSALLAALRPLRALTAPQTAIFCPAGRARYRINSPFASLTTATAAA